MKLEKKPKIVDCVLFYDEIDMLFFRLNEIGHLVDKIIIIEGRIDFLKNDKILNFNIADPIYDKWKHKITHLTYSRIDLDELETFYSDSKYFQFQRENSVFHRDRSEVVDLALYKLRQKLINSDLDFDDMILLSEVDELPSIEDIDNIKSKLNFERIVCEQKNFVWDYNFIEQFPHNGTCIFSLSNILTDKKILNVTYNTKENKSLGNIVRIKNGYHFNYFYDLKKLSKKLELLFNGNDEVSFTEEQINQCRFDMINPNQIGKPYKLSLVKYNDELPKNIQLLKPIPFQFDNQRTILITFDKIYVSDFDMNFNFNLNSEGNDKIILPNKVYYNAESISLEEFKLLYALNELNKKLSKKLILENDILVISYGDIHPNRKSIENELLKKFPIHDSEKKLIICDRRWLRTNFISDLF